MRYKTLNPINYNFNRSLSLKKLKQFARHCRDRSVLWGLSRPDREIITRLKSENLTYLKVSKLSSLVRTCRDCLNINGIFIEAGCALGGSAILATSIKEQSRVFQIYDVFGMIPPPTENDPLDVQERYKVISEGKSTGIAGGAYYGYMEDLEDVVKGNFEKFGFCPELNNVSFIKGLLEETMNITVPVAFAHIDVDWYSPVYESLIRITPHLTLGGSIILDDYFDWGGCRKAADDFLESHPRIYRKDGSSGAMKLTRIS